MELLERGQFLQSLLDCPPGRVVLVSGEAGIGKTSLMKAWCRCQQARAVGFVRRHADTAAAWPAP